MPWTGLMFNFDGKVKNCIRSSGHIGHLKHQDIQEILMGDINQLTQSEMIADRPGPNCRPCYDLESGKKGFDIVSDRVFYMRELKNTPLDIYQQGQHDLKIIDVRWTNLCNFACVYCSPEFSSKWASEIGIITHGPSDEQLQRFKNYIFDHAAQLKHVYLAGGEPLLMKENLELLELLKEKNPQVNLRINTNLSKVDTKIFDTICGFSNVHWTVSVESMNDEFEYIRYGGSWTDFLENLDYIRTLDHRISFNMLYFLLNYRSFFDCLAFLQGSGFHNNSFIAGALLTPIYLNIRNLPDDVLQSVKTKLQEEINKRPGYLLEDSLKNLHAYIDTPFEKDLEASFREIEKLDRRRKLNSRLIFKDLYTLRETDHGQTI